MTSEGCTPSVRFWRGEHAASLDVGRLWIAVGRMTRWRLTAYRYTGPTGGGIWIGRWYIDAGLTTPASTPSPSDVTP